MKKEVAIVIPVNRNDLDLYEIISIEQAINVLQERDIYFVIPESMRYELKYDVNIIVVSDCFFGSIVAHNRLLLSVEFYKLFSEYEYILLHHTDALVFSDKLSYFCSLGYDYIGAPWLGGVDVLVGNIVKTIFVGNGGLSLRKVEKYISILNNRRDFLATYTENEDVFFSSLENDEFNVATFNIALSFSIEAEVRECLLLNKGKLPFGCHGWNKYDASTWKKYISIRPDIIDMIVDNRQDAFNRLLVCASNESVNYQFELSKLLSHYLIGKKIYIWGAGYVGSLVKKVLENSGWRIQGYIDSNPQLIGTLKDGIKIRALSDVFENALIIVSFRLIEKKLLDKLNKCDYILWSDILV